MATDKDDPFGTPAESDDTFSVEAIEDTGYRIEKGKYVGKLIDLQKGTSKAANPMWIWVFVLLNGPGAGRELKVWTALTSAAMWKLAEVLAALGLGQTGKATQFKKSEAIGKLAILDVVDDEYQGKKSSKVENMYPIPADKLEMYTKMADAMGKAEKDIPA